VLSNQTSFPAPPSPFAAQKINLINQSVHPLIHPLGTPLLGGSSFLVLWQRGALSVLSPETYIISRWLDQ
jgi:hypothetical protein